VKQRNFTDGTTVRGVINELFIRSIMQET